MTEVVVAGSPKLGTMMGAQGCHKYMRFSHFGKLTESVAYLRARGATLCGVEINPRATPIQNHGFRGTTAFLLGNEGSGLSRELLQICDHLVYIPQHSAATASLNINAAAAVALHHFALWASLSEAPRDGTNDGKFERGPPLSVIPNSGVGYRQMRTLQPDGSPLGRGSGSVVVNSCRPALDADSEFRL